MVVMQMPLPSETQEVLQAVEGVLGSSGWVLVGGSVRDVLLGDAPKDYDVATVLLPDEVEKRVRAAGKRPHIVGKRFGTVGFRYGGHFIEVTTYRSELYNLGSRKPEVTFTDNLEQDLSRRDFTINAMALTKEGRLIDPFQGQDDLRTGVIRAVGEARERFREDPLRKLRMLRFVARFGFVIEPATAQATSKYGYMLTTISSERISAELDGILLAPHAPAALQQMAELRLLPFVLPLLVIQVGYDQQTPYHRFTLWEHSLKTMSAVPPDIELRWAALLHDVGKPFVRVDKAGRSSYVHHDRVGEVLVTMISAHLKWSRQRTQRIRELVRTHMDTANPLRAADNAAK